MIQNRIDLPIFYRIPSEGFKQVIEASKAAKAKPSESLKASRESKDSFKSLLMSTGAKTSKLWQFDVIIAPTIMVRTPVERAYVNRILEKALDNPHLDLGSMIRYTKLAGEDRPVVRIIPVVLPTEMNLWETSTFPEHVIILESTDVIPLVQLLINAVYKPEDYEEDDLDAVKRRLDKVPRNVFLKLLTTLYPSLALTSRIYVNSYTIEESTKLHKLHGNVDPSNLSLDSATTILRYYGAKVVEEQLSMLLSAKYGSRLSAAKDILGLEARLASLAWLSRVESVMAAHPLVAIAEEILVMIALVL